MSALSNARWERFAQELAKGKSASEAYTLAGYAANEGNAGRLNRNEQVRARVSELKERAALRTELTLVSITERLVAIADKAEALGEAAGFSVARAAMMDAAKLNGHVVDRSENRNTIVRSHEDMLDDLERASTEEIVVARH